MVRGLEGVLLVGKERLSSILRSLLNRTINSFRHNLRVRHGEGRAKSVSVDCWLDVGLVTVT